jgi:DNA-binding NtrC family response regulator
MGRHALDPRVLIAGNSADIETAIRDLLSGYHPALESGEDPAVLAAVRDRSSIRLVVLCDSGIDLRGLNLLQEIKRVRPEVAVLLVSAHPTVEHATEAIRRGAEDFVPVPYTEDIVLKEVARVLEAAELRDRVDSLDRLVSMRYGFERVVSQSPRMHAVVDRAQAASRSDTPVLILGETGTGKELIARAIHANSNRAQRPFVPVNCAALPKDLVESELFGHRRGAFSGALTDHPGLFMAAHRGSLFLDEIGELPLDVQAKLLRVLQDRDVRPVGGLESRHVDVRIIAASNRTLMSLRDGGMRPDLFFRLTVVVVEIPPLRERREDLPLLTAHFLRGIRDRGGHVEGIESGALELLSRYPFPGNIRELENLLESVSLTLPADRHVITVPDVRSWLHRRGEAVEHRTAAVSQVSLKLAELEAWAITEAIRQAHGNKRLAAQILGISRDTLYRKIHELSLPADLSDSRT